MIVGVVKERKSQENRVGMLPNGARALVELGAEVWVEKSAGEGSGIFDSAYAEAGAKIVDDRHDIYAGAELIIKVKEPLADEVSLYREGQTLYTYLHLAAAKELTIGLMERGVTSIAYETIQLADGSLPLLKPMSEVAGKMSVQLGATHLQRDHQGKGILLGGVPGIRRGKVVVIGGGIVGRNAIKIAVGLGAEVIALDIDANSLEYLDDIYGNRISTLMSNPANIRSAVSEADLVIGAVLIPGAKSPKLLTRDMLKDMQAGSVIVDVSVDQGGCFETSRPTTYDDPTFVVDDVIHYCVANIPGTVARSSTEALTNATLPYALNMLRQGIMPAVQQDPALKLGVNTYKKRITCEAVAEAHKLEYTPFDAI